MSNVITAKLRHCFTDKVCSAFVLHDREVKADENIKFRVEYGEKIAGVLI